MTTASTPALGKAIRDRFLLDPAFLTVNHGAYGATPRPVLEAQEHWRRRMEAQPTRFMQRELPAALAQARARLGEFLGAQGDDLAFVDNATTGCNAVLRALALGQGDEIVLLHHGYGAVRNAVRHIAGLAGGRIVEAAFAFPQPEPEAIVASVAHALGLRTKLVVLDHITSPSALVLPLERLIATCRAAGVPVLVDGAHGPGQLTLDLGRLGADWYVGNCHKWLCAPKGCAFLWARADRQDSLHPLTISHGYGQGFRAEFDWTGTRDPSAFLAVDAAIDFHEQLGGGALRSRNAALAREATALVARRLNTDAAADPAMHAAMGLVRLPHDGPATPQNALALRTRLIDEFSTDVPLFALAGSLWLRLSAHAYNEIGDYAELAERAARLLA